jgi:hypothetical protein
MIEKKIPKRLAGRFPSDMDLLLECDNRSEIATASGVLE